MKSLMFKTFLILLFSVGIVEAQGPTALWDQDQVTGITQANSFQYRVYVTPAGALAPTINVILTSVNCSAIAGTTTRVSCAGYLGPVAGPAALLPGAKSELTAKDGTSAESPKSIPFIMTAQAKPASVPGNFRIIP